MQPRVEPGQQARESGHKRKGDGITRAMKETQQENWVGRQEGREREVALTKVFVGN